jgi:inorganic pyrophosphatase
MRVATDTALVVIETPRGSVVKRRTDGGVRFASPVPAPYNYGSVPDTVGADGDPQDAIVLGPRLPRGHAGRWRVHGVVRFVDGGRPDDKLVCGEHPPSAWDLWRLHAFFIVYARTKSLANRLRGRGPTRYRGYQAAPLRT